MKTKLAFAIACLIFTGGLSLGQETIPFNQEKWNIFAGRSLEFEGKDAFMGSATLKDLSFTNGTIELDLYVTGQRSFPGLIFRMQDSGDYELFYIRPHKLDGLNHDALQYTPVFHNVSCWQLYHGEGYTKEILMPSNKWVHVRLEVSGQTAQVFVGAEEEPSLFIHQLELPMKAGSIGVYGPANGTAYFANFKYSDHLPDVAPAHPKPKVPGVISDWSISSPMSSNLVDPYSLPSGSQLDDLTWKSVQSDPGGLVNLSRELVRNPTQPGWVIAKTTITAEQAGLHRFGLGYSDLVSVFLNGEAVFTGVSTFRSRDPSFAGLVGYNDELHLKLRKGDNELCLLIGENMGGWGFMLRDAEAIEHSENMTKLWELPYQLDYPESAEYDPIREVIYVSNNLKRPTESISKISLGGEIIEKDWVKGLYAPTGLKLAGDKLYVVERRAVAVIDITSGEIEKRIILPGPVFPNDITGTDDGSVLYVSDGGQNAIYKIEEGEAGIWMQGGVLIQPNGLYLNGDILLVGCSGYPALLEINIKTQASKTLDTLFPGAVMDGIQVTKSGNILYSDWNGHLFKRAPSGETTEILNTSTAGIQLADFKWIEEKNLLIIPSLYDNRVMCWKIFHSFKN
ncbi:MAG: hypothetical protein HN352_17010 [Bacteroidetes bacterium]|nr:hypothetical protein [Bacteroidota bacterium]MBT3750863.1 hypothetical protein [Bacteroidota bacterium]MBT7094289.1 hypothetical protein [Bacteroidota bacterium]MBT7465196.1 hypothetical protein [Bacteroidota bacterium]